MNEYPSTQNETSILDDPYQKEVQLYHWQHERKKVMITLFIIAGILLASDLIALAMVNAFSPLLLPYILLFPAAFVGLGLFARLQPLIAAIGGIVLLVTIVVLNITTAGAVTLVSGWLFKAVVLYYIIKCFRHATEAEKARKQLQQLE